MTAQMTLNIPKQSYTMQFHRPDGSTIGTLDFNGPSMTFTGDAEESARLFFDLVSQHFSQRLADEREAPRREWVDLSDDDVDELQSQMQASHKDIRIIEAAIKEKNA